MAIGDRLLAKTANISAKENVLKSDISEPKTSPGRLLDVQGKIHAAEERVLSLQKELGKALTLPIDQLVASPFQTRKLDLARVRELKEHLACNKLATPISVRPSSLYLGKFEILSGHHRVEAFKELGRTEIEAIIQIMDDQEAQERIFYDNLFAPDLPDFEKYKGFSAIRQRTGQSHNALAEEAGISKTLVTFLFAFEKLPRKALDLLEIHPTLIGATAAQKIASVKADEDKVVTGLQKIIAKELDQKTIITFLKSDESQKSTPQHIEHVIKQGKQTVCRLSTKNNNSITLTFETGFNAQDWHQRLVAFIEKEFGCFN